MQLTFTSELDVCGRPLFANPVYITYFWVFAQLYNVYGIAQFIDTTKIWFQPRYKAHCISKTTFGNKIFIIITKESSINSLIKYHRCPLIMRYHILNIPAQSAFPEQHVVHQTGHQASCSSNEFQILYPHNRGHHGWSCLAWSATCDNNMSVVINITDTLNTREGAM